MKTCFVLAAGTALFLFSGIASAYSQEEVNAFETPSQQADTGKVQQTSIPGSKAETTDSHRQMSESGVRKIPLATPQVLPDDSH
ncbi:hypothetical protein PQQ65_34105 [Paraburkholderia strydomiana]|uniref:hypothetical protein n=1 Tax=Paraburkholderia strydomiana TaxID=1245417 RepID=UPI0038BA7C1A